MSETNVAIPPAGPAYTGGVPQSGMSQADFLAAYQRLLAQGVSSGDAIAQLQAQNGGNLPVGNTASATPTSTADAVAKIQQTQTSGGGGDTWDLRGSGLTDPFTETFTAPTPQALPNAPSYTAPTFTAPSYTKPDAFSYADYQKPADFVAPTAESVLSDPGYKFGLDQGVSTLSNAKAAQGLFGTGSTLKDIIGYGNDYATGKYDDAYSRQLSTYNTNTASGLNAYNTNRAGAVNDYNTNYQTQYIDPYKFAYQGALDSFAPQMAQFNANVNAGNLAYSTQAAATQHSNDTNYSNAWNSFLFDYNKFRNQQLDTYNKLAPVALA